PETAAIEPIGCGVLDPRMRGDDDDMWLAISPSFATTWSGRAPHAMKAIQFRGMKLPEPSSAAGVISVAGSMIAAIERENPGAAAFPGCFSLVQSDGCESHTARCGSE